MHTAFGRTNDQIQILILRSFATTPLQKNERFNYFDHPIDPCPLLIKSNKLQSTSKQKTKHKIPLQFITKLQRTSELNMLIQASSSIKTNQSNSTMQTIGGRPNANLIKEKEKEMFNKARGLVNPVSQFFAKFFSERKLLVFMMLYSAALLVVFGHFALTTGNHNWHKVRPSFDHYWMLTRFPMIEAGGVNACLLIWALLPLTMTHFTISKLGDTFIGKFIPFRRFVRVHIFYAWTLMIFFTGLLAGFLPMIFRVRNSFFVDNILLLTSIMRYLTFLPFVLRL